jgi:hypothetical protein
VHREQHQPSVRMAAGRSKLGQGSKCSSSSTTVGSLLYDLAMHVHPESIL